jgi:hypothetical protein
VYKGEDVSVTVTMVPSTNILGWTFAFTLKLLESDAAPVLTLPNSSFTITDPANGVFRLVIGATAWAGPPPIAVRMYRYDIWRVDSGSATAIVVGALNLLPSPRGGT